MIGLSSVLVVAAMLALALPLGVAIVSRPQRGLLLLAALVPFDGLLLIVPGGEAVGPWKEALLAVTLAAAVVAPVAARRQDAGPVPPWVLPVVGFVLIGVVSAVLVGGIVGTWGLKVGYFYVLIPVVLWRCPFDVRDRDRLVSILMATGAVTAGFGLVQQAIGPESLVALGYEYNTAIRFSGDVLRSFSTFTQPFSFGLFLSMVLLVCLPVAMADPRRLRNQAFLVLTPFLVVAMAVSVVRGAALALAAGLAVLAVWRFRGLVHLAAPVGIGLLLVPASFLTAYLSSSSLGQRASGWSVVLERATATPLGAGIGTTGAAAEKSLELGAEPSAVITLGRDELYLPDNLYVKTFVELGPLGLWLLLLVGASIVAAGVTAARGTTGDDRSLAQGITASVVGAAAASAVSTYLEIFPLDLYFWLLVGVLTCLNPSPSRSATSRSTPSRCVPTAAASRPTSVSSSAR